MNSVQWHDKYHGQEHIIDNIFYCGSIDVWYMKHITHNNISDYHEKLTSYNFTNDLP